MKSFLNLHTRESTKNQGGINGIDPVQEKIYKKNVAMAK